MADFFNIEGTKRIKRLKDFKPVLSLEEIIRYCIKNKLKMDILYKDDESNVLEGYRGISPAAFGILKGTGNQALRAYLNDGVSKSQRIPKWRLFRLDRIKQYNINFDKFSINSLYRMGDKHMSSIESQLIKKSFENLLS